MSALDWLLVAWVALWAVLGAARGMTEQVLSLAGLAVGAALGSRLAPLLLPDGRESPWLPLVALGTAIVGAVLAQAVLLRLAAPLRRLVARHPLRRVDQAGGMVTGAAIALALAWLAGAVALYQPGDGATGIREEVQRSSILSAALRAVPPDRVLGALARIDPFPVIPLPAAALPPPDESVLRDPVALRARGSVVQIRGRACGLVKQGTGWVVRDGLVATNAHVIAGQDDTRLIPPGGTSLAAQPVYVDRRDDVALLRVPGLDLRPLRARRRAGRPRAGRPHGLPGRGPADGRGRHRRGAPHRHRAGRLRPRPRRPQRRGDARHPGARQQRRAGGRPRRRGRGDDLRRVGRRRLRGRRPAGPDPRGALLAAHPRGCGALRMRVRSAA